MTSFADMAKPTALETSAHPPGSFEAYSNNKYYRQAPDVYHDLMYHMKAIIAAYNVRQTKNKKSTAFVGEMLTYYVLLQMRPDVSLWPKDYRYALFARMFATPFVRELLHLHADTLASFQDIHKDAIMKLPATFLIIPPDIAFAPRAPSTTPKTPKTIAGSKRGAKRTKPDAPAPATTAANTPALSSGAAGAEPCQSTLAPGNPSSPVFAKSGAASTSRIVYSPPTDYSPGDPDWIYGDATSSEDDPTYPDFEDPAAAGPKIAAPQIAGPEIAAPQIAGPEIAAPPEIEFPPRYAPSLSDPRSLAWARRFVVESDLQIMNPSLSPSMNLATAMVMVERLRHLLDQQTTFAECQISRANNRVNTLEANNRHLAAQVDKLQGELDTGRHADGSAARSTHSTQVAALLHHHSAGAILVSQQEQDDHEQLTRIAASLSAILGEKIEVDRMEQSRLIARGEFRHKLLAESAAKRAAFQPGEAEAPMDIA